MLCRGYDNGHRGIWLERGQDNLIANFRLDARMYHDLSVSFYEHGTVFVNGTGKVRCAWWPLLAMVLYCYCTACCVEVTRVDSLVA